MSLILDLLADGVSIEEIKREYPGIERDDILACIAYASEMSRQHFVELEIRA